jgi:hypothetical protein
VKHFDCLEAELDQLVATGAQPEPRRAGERNGRLALQVVQLLESAPTEAFAVLEVAKRLDVSSLPALRKTVLRLVAQRKIQRRRRGMYGVAQRRVG